MKMTRSPQMKFVMVIMTDWRPKLRYSWGGCPGPIVRCGWVLFGQPNVDATAKRFDVIDAITPEIEAMAGDAGRIVQGRHENQIDGCENRNCRGMRHGDHRRIAFKPIIRH